MSAALAAARDRIARGEVHDALAILADGLRAEPRSIALWRTLGQLYLGLPQPIDALACFERALGLDPTDIDSVHGAAASQQALGYPARAVAVYRAALQQQPDQSGLRLGLAAALLETGEAASAAREAECAAGSEPDNVAALRVLGDCALALNQASAAMAAFRRAAELDPRRADGHYALGLACLKADQPATALAAFEAALATEPGHGAALAQLCHLKRRLCDWSGLAALNERLRAAVDGGAAGITPFSFLAETGDPAEQLACARLWAGQVRQDATALAPRIAAAAPDRLDHTAPLRVGLVSSGFGNHPTALLVAELVEHLRDSGLATLGFATSADDGGAMRLRLRQAFHRFEDVSGLDPAALAERLRRSRLDIVFDLRGYGEGAISPVYALRVAPVQVNWLAYPGSQGAPFMDYLLADRFVAPEAERAHYSEALVRLPHCFQPSDSTRRIPQPPTRAECGLPGHGPVLASFNNSYKIAPEVFEAWMTILRRAPEATLWLLQSGPGEMVENLRRVAAARQVDPGRLRFMAKLPHPEYLARYRHVDLFLDTWPYNAHTTASDALFAGCPVLTVPGRSFAARVAGSLLTTLGLDPLIACDSADYIERAVALVSDAEARAALRVRLDQARRDSPLFDMRRFAGDFAAAVRWMVGRQRQGLPPTDHDL